MGRPGLNKFAASLENPICLLRAPLARLLFVLALTQMSYASAVKKFHELGAYMGSLGSFFGGIGQNEEPSNLDELSRFFAEGPSRCRFPKYRLGTPTLLLRFASAPLRDAEEALAAAALEAGNLRVSRPCFVGSDVALKDSISDSIIHASIRKRMIKIEITSNQMISNG